MNLEKEFLTVDDIADKLGLTEMTIYRLIKNGSIPSYKIGSSWRIKQEDFEKFMNDMKTKIKE